MASYCCLRQPLSTFFVASAGLLAVPTLLYFALAIALLSQARFSVTQSGWQAQGIEVQPEVARRWLVWVVVFLLGVSLVALILPTYYTLGPLQACLGVLGMVYAVLSFLVSLLLLPGHTAVRVALAQCG